MARWMAWKYFLGGTGNYATHSLGLDNRVGAINLARNPLRQTQSALSLLFFKP